MNDIEMILEDLLARPMWSEQTHSEMIGALSGLDLSGVLASMMQSALEQTHWDRLTTLLFIANEFPSKELVPVLCQALATRSEQLNNENIVEILDKLADPASIPCLRAALTWHSQYDEFHWLGVKAVWALHAIGTPEAWSIIRQEAVSGETIKVRGAAVAALQRAGYELPFPLVTEPYLAQAQSWPASGRRIMANFDDHTIVVYQAYNPAIGHAAARSGRLGGGGFSFDRMSWIKPNFLWMMYRSGWGTKPNQEVTLAIRMWRSGFEEILRTSVASTFDASGFGNHATWKRALAESSVRLQWDPDHDPQGRRVERRALQLGLRGQSLDRFVREWTIEIHDVSDFVVEQRERVAGGDMEALDIPREHEYPIEDSELAARIGLDRE